MKRKLILKAAYILTILLTLTLVRVGNRAVTVISQGLPVSREFCFVIDPGHGGVDGGATSCTGKLESAFNLEISLRLNDLLRFLGYETCTIRTEDISIHTNRLYPHDMSKAIELVASGKINFKPMITHRCSLEEFPEMARKIVAKELDSIKVIVEVNE